MKTRILRLATFMCVLALSYQAHAQTQDYNEGVKSELNQEMEQMYPKRNKKVSRPVVQNVEVESVSNDRVQPAGQSAGNQVQIQQAPASQPIYILQQPTAVPQAQQQPLTTIEAAPIRESKSEALRKQREEVERQTEDKMVNRLEDDRLQSEKERADRLFNPKPVVAPEPVSEKHVEPVQAPVQVVVTPQPEIATVRASREDVAPIQSQEQSTKFSVGGLVGIGSYPSLDNVNGSYAAGLLAEMSFDERFGIELSGIFSNYDLKNLTPNFYIPSYIVSVNQFDLTTGLDYKILDTRITPVVGLLAGYTRRSYSDRVTYGYSSPMKGSNAFNGGFRIGVDVKAGKRLTVGADMRYMMNLSYRTDDALAYNAAAYNSTSPIEGSSYYFATVNLKFAL